MIDLYISLIRASYDSFAKFASRFPWVRRNFFFYRASTQPSATQYFSCHTFLTALFNSPLSTPSLPPQCSDSLFK